MIVSQQARAGRGRTLAVATIAVGVLLAMPQVAPAVSRVARGHDAGQDAAKPFFDSRVATRHAAKANGRVAASAQERSTRTQLRSSLGRQAVLQVDPVTGTARSVQRLDGTLTGPAAGDRSAIALGWLRTNRAALGLTAADLDGLTPADRTVSKLHDITHLRYRQAFHGIPTFDNGLRVNLDRSGRILNVTGAPISGLRVDSVSPKLDAGAAMAALQRNVGVQRVTAITSGPSGARRVTHFSRGDFARLVLFGSAGGARLAWHVTYQATSLAWYDAVVDATTGAILFRQNLVKFDSDQSVFPDYPGAEEAPNPKGANNAKVPVNLETKGWLPNGETTLNGPNAHVWSDVTDDNLVGAGEEITRPAAGNFVDTFTEFPTPDPVTYANACDFTAPDPGWPDPLATKARCAWDPTDPASWEDNRAQDGVQAFYFVNEFHDHLESGPIGFDAADGNFEGADAVEVNADDGADSAGDGGPDGDHINNANMGTPPDGLPPRMQMYLFAYDPDRFFAFRNINGGDDAGTVWHEYTHGLSNRLVTNDDGSGATSSPHAGAMGEAWSDWYALDLLHRRNLENDDPNTSGEVDIGIYTDARFTATRLEPIDCPVNSVAPRCPGGIATGHGGYTFGDFGKVAGAPEVHSDGEIWMQTLWDLRTRLTELYGNEADGSDVSEFLVTEAMRLSPPEPSFLDMRNAILAAVETVSSDPDEIAAVRDITWSVFAGRGMGFYSSAVDSSDVTPAEDFSVPPDPDAATGTTTGTVTSADTGLPVANVLVGFGGLTTVTKDPSAPFPNGVATHTAANGSYSLTAPAGRYGDLVVSAGAGYDVVSLPDFTVTGGATRTQNVAVRRDWSASKGGAEVIIDDSKYDNTGGGFGCGLPQLIDQSQGAGDSAFNPDSADPDNPHLGPPTALIHLPQTVDVSAFGLDPSNTCGDDPSAATKDYKIETSTDGVNFHLAKQGSFTPDDLARLNVVAPTANAQNVRWVRLTMLNPQSAEPGDSGVDFIDFSEIEVFGGPRNVLPTGSLQGSPGTVAPGRAVTFDASSFRDSDSRITGYDWDFDGNGTVDRSTTAPTTSFAYTRAGTFTAHVAAKDFRGGAGTATKQIKVTRGPRVSLPTSGSGGATRFRVTCETRCTATARLRLSKSLAKALGLKSRTVGSLRRTLGQAGSRRLTIKLTSKAKRALRRHDRTSVKVTLTLTVRNADGRSKTAHRTLRIRI